MIDANKYESMTREDLLAEVKRLRERVLTLESLMEYFAEDYEEKVIE